MEDLVKTIHDELTLCYESSGRKSPESLLAVAASHAESIPFRDAGHVHEAFKMARNVEPIPTQKTLRECADNYSQEVLKYEYMDNGASAIEYRDPRSAWLPKDDIRRRINLQEAVKRYCVAHSDRLYGEYCKLHSTTSRKVGAERVVSWTNESAVESFDRPIKEYLKYLYREYLRRTPAYANFPRRAMLNLGLIPPSVNEFRIMLKEEEKRRNDVHVRPTIRAAMPA